MDQFVRQQFAEARSDPEAKFTGTCLRFLRGSHRPIPVRGRGKVRDLVLHQHPVDLSSIKGAVAQNGAPSEQEWADHGVVEASAPGRVAEIPIDIVVAQIESKTHMFLDPGQRLHGDKNTLGRSADAQRVQQDEWLVSAQRGDTVQRRCRMEIGPE